MPYPLLGMKISSPVFSPGDTIPLLYTCLGANHNPPLLFEDIPLHTQSMVLTFEDIDAPNHWIHWLVFNIPSTTRIVNEHEIPVGGIEGLANNKSFGYEGPCPRYFSDTHQYRFTLYALDAVLDIPKESDTKVVMDAAKGHVLAKAELIGIQKGTL